MSATDTAAYLRVSGRPGQSVETQRPILEALAARLGLSVDVWYEEEESAAKRRPVYDQMMADAKRGRFGTLLTYALDRLGRNMVQTFLAVNDLDTLRVRVVSDREPWLDTAGPTRSLLLAVFSWVAEQERVRLVERTHAGLARARAAGKVLGRPRSLEATQVASARSLRGEGQSWSRVAAAVGAPATTVRRALAEKGVPRVVRGSVENRPQEVCPADTNDSGTGEGMGEGLPNDAEESTL